MATLRPFRALKPSPEHAAEVAAVPYDVVSTEEARAQASGKPLSFLHVSRAEIDLPEGTNPYADEVYAKAAENFEKLKREAPLTLERSERLYVYRLRMGSHEQTGVAGCCSLDEYDQDRIRKHERTRREKEDDRTRHMVGLGAQTGPVFLTYRGRSQIDAIVESATRRPPLYDFKASDGVQHTVWELDPEESGRLSEQFQPVPLLYIADGHHRAASASRARQELGARSPRHTGQEAYNYFLAVVVPAGQLRILSYHRVVKDLAGRSNEQFLAGLKERLTITEKAPASPQRRGDVSVYLGGTWYGAQLLRPSGARPNEILDAGLLEDQVLDPLLGIKDVRTDKRIDFVGGIRGIAELERLVDSGRFAVAFSLYPVTLDELMSIADAKQIMPPKSTWFEPKLQDGLLIHEI